MEEVLTPTDWSQVKDAMTESDSRYAMDSKLFVQFYLRPVLMRTQSDAENRPVFMDVDHVRIIVPGDKHNIIDRVASDDDKARFSAHYAKFKAGQSQETIGTPLEAVSWMTRSKVEEYKFFNIKTVEQLAEASDQVGQKFPGFMADREKSRKFLEASGGTNARVTELEAQLAELKAMVAAQQAKGPPAAQGEKK